MQNLSVVTWLWKGNRDYKPEHVAVLASMFRRHLSAPHRFVCITDVPGDFGRGVDVVPTPPAAQALGDYRTPEAPEFPSCYRRLWMFSEEARCLGERVLLVDIDLVLTANIDHLVDRDDSFVGWVPRQPWGHGPRLAGGLYLMTTGSCTEVFEQFNGQPAIDAARGAGFRGSDQAWISYQLADKVVVWPDDAGIYSIRDLGSRLPRDASLVQFNGPGKPWQLSAPEWAVEHWH